MGKFRGSMRHTATGRKKKTNYWKKVKGYQGQFVPMSTADTSTYRRETAHYPSRDDPKTTTHKPTLTREERLEISSQYTVAPAYNKSGYQVIPKDDIEHIGR